MSSSRSNLLWLVNVISFLLFSILGITGLINWLVLPKGPGAGGGFLISLRHLLRNVHQWVALMFMVAIVVHLILHWRYIKPNLQRYGLLKSKSRRPQV